MATTSASPAHSIASASASNIPQAHPLPQQQQQQPQAASPVRPPPLPTAFEFTRRKKWADLLITELTDAIVFVLSPQAKVLFCSHAVQELLGWKDDEIVDRDLFDWVHAADHETLRASLLQSQHDNREMLSYARLRCKPDAFQPLHAQAPPPPVILFELAARPHIVPGEHSSRCIFTVAKPYPSRNTAMLNTFLELKIENARLQDRLHALRTHQSTHPLPRPHPHPRTHSQTYNPPASSSSSAPASVVTTAVAPSLQLAIDTRDPQAYFAALGAPLSAGPGSASAGGPGLDDDEGGDKLRKKRKVSAPEQYVCNTCGRTDSPEWRKGPRGPKTLCNACGLRWAKKVRKFEEGGGEASQQPLDDIVPP